MTFCHNALLWPGIKTLSAATVNISRRVLRSRGLELDQPAQGLWAFLIQPSLSVKVQGFPTKLNCINNITTLSCQLSAFLMAQEPVTQEALPGSGFPNFTRALTSLSNS